MTQLRAILDSDQQFRNLLAAATVAVTLAVVWTILLFDGLLLPALALLGVATLWVISRRPDWGLYILLFITYLRLSNVAIQFHGVPSVAKFFVVALLGVIIYRIYAYGDRPDGWRTTFLLLAVYGLALFGSLLFARDLGLALEGFEDYIKNCIVALAITLLLDRPERLRWAIWSILAAGLIMASLTVWQAVTNSYDTVYFGLAQFSAEGSILVGQQGNRAAGPVGDPNFYSQFLVILIPLALERFWHERRLGWRAVAGITVTMLILANVFTFSRGGFLAMILVVAIMLWQSPPRPIVLIISLALALLIWPFVPEQYLQRMSTIAGAANFAADAEATPQADGAIVGRLSEMRAAAAVFWDNPILGVGLDNFALYYPEYSERIGLDPNRSTRSAHDLYLEILAESGIIGFAAFGLIVVTMFRGLRHAYQRFRMARQIELASITFALGVSLVGFLVNALFLHAGYPRYWWLLVGLILSIPEISRTYGGDTEVAAR